MSIIFRKNFSSSFYDRQRWKGRPNTALFLLNTNQFALIKIPFFNQYQTWWWWWMDGWMGSFLPFLPSIQKTLLTTFDNKNGVNQVEMLLYSMGEQLARYFGIIIYRELFPLLLLACIDSGVFFFFPFFYFFFLLLFREDAHEAIDFLLPRLSIHHSPLWVVAVVCVCVCASITTNCISNLV